MKARKSLTHSCSHLEQRILQRIVDLYMNINTYIIFLKLHTKIPFKLLFPFLVTWKTHFVYFHFLFLFIWSVFSSKMYSRKDTSSNYIEFSKKQTSLPGPKNFSRGKLFWTLLSTIHEFGQLRKTCKYILVKKKEKQTQQSEILLFTMLRTMGLLLC